MKFFSSGFLLLLLMLASSKLLAQTNFIEGLIVTDVGDTLYGKIDFRDWSKNPTSIDFIEEGRDVVQNLIPGNIKEFNVGINRYLSRKVSIDLTPLKVSARTETPVTSMERTVFLKVLVLGKLSLYSYRHNRVNFYLEEEGRITELISHQAAVTRGGSLVLDTREQFLYKAQLSEINTICIEENPQTVAYKASSLMEFVLGCNYRGSESDNGDVSYVLEKKKTVISPGIIVGFGTEYFNYGRGVNEQEILESQKNTAENFTFGFKLKFIFPENMQRNSASLSLEYSKIKFEPESGYRRYIGYRDFESLNFKVWYSTRVYARTISPVFDMGVSISKKITDTENEDFEPVFKTRPGYFIGAGLEIGGLYSVLRFDIRPRGGFSTDQRTISLLFGYEF